VDGREVNALILQAEFFDNSDAAQYHRTSGSEGGDVSGAEAAQAYIDGLDEPRRSELNQIHAFIRTTVPDLDPYMYGKDLIGYGRYHYKYATGREGEASIIGLSSRKAYISVYATGGDGEQYVAERFKDQMPKADIGKSCIRFKKFEHIDFDVLGKILKESEAIMAPLKVPVEG
jgi:hypothetical protein